MPIKLFTRFALTLLFAFVFASAGAQAKTERRTIDTERFERLQKSKNAVIVDVRTAEEYNAGRIPGAVHIDVQKDDFTQRIQSLDKKKTYLLYCKSGRRSEKAMNLLYDNGFRNVYHLKGGYTAWSATKK